jgi:hypothetical protein
MLKSRKAIEMEIVGMSKREALAYLVELCGEDFKYSYHETKKGIPESLIFQVGKYHFWAMFDKDSRRIEKVA